MPRSTPCAILLLALCFACAPGLTAPVLPGESHSLEDRIWVLARLSGTDFDPSGPGRPPHLRLDPDKTRARGFAGCNTFSGGYVLQGQGLRFSSLATTRMACEKGMDVEHQLLDALSRTEAWAIADGRLELIDRVGSVLAVFTNAAER